MKQRVIATLLMLALVLALSVPGVTAVAELPSCHASIWIAEATKTDQNAVLRVEITGMRPPLHFSIDEEKRIAEGDHAVLLHLARPLPPGARATVLSWPSGLEFYAAQIATSKEHYIFIASEALRTIDVSEYEVVFVIYFNVPPHEVHVEGVQTWGAAIPPGGRPGQTPYRWCTFDFHWYPKGSRQ